MTIKAARLKDRHAVHPEDTESLTMAVRTLGIVLLFSFVTALSGLPTIAPGERINYALHKRTKITNTLGKLLLLQLYLMRNLFVLYFTRKISSTFILKGN